MLKLTVKHVIHGYVMTTQKGLSRKIFSLGFQKCMHFARKFSRGPQVHERVLMGLRIGICLENTAEKLILRSIIHLKVAATLPVFQGRAQLDYGNHIIKFCVESTC